MSNYKINKNIKLSKLMINNQKKADQEYYLKNPDSVIRLFEKELRELGFVFEISTQIYGFMPKHKDIVLPLAIKFYNLSKINGNRNDMFYFVRMFNYKGCDVVIPMLLDDLKNDEIDKSIKWIITDCLYTMRSKKYIDEYLLLISMKELEINRQMLILLVGKLHVQRATPLLIELLEDETVRTQVLSALGEFKNPEFKPYFERFVHDKHPGWRKSAIQSLNKISKLNHTDM